MASGGGKQVPLSYFWGIIRSAVFANATTGALWAAVNAAREKEGLTFAPGAFFQMQSLRSLGVRQRQSTRALQSSEDTANPADFVTQDIDSGDLNAQNAFPVYRVRFEHLVNTEAGQESRWRTTYFFGQLPPTMGDLRDELEAQGLEMTQEGGSDRGAIHVGVGQIENPVRV